MELRNSTNIAEDINTFDVLLNTINDIIIDINEYIKIIDTSHIDDIEFLHQIIYGLNTTIHKINIYINSLNSVDSITDILDSIQLN